MREEARLTRFEASRPPPAALSLLPASGAQEEEKGGGGLEWADSWGKGWVVLSSEESGRCPPVCCGFSFSGQPSPWMVHTAYVKSKRKGRSLFGGGGKKSRALCTENPAGKDTDAQVPSPAQGF